MSEDGSQPRTASFLAGGTKQGWPMAKLAYDDAHNIYTVMDNDIVVWGWQVYIIISGLQHPKSKTTYSEVSYRNSNIICILYVHVFPSPNSFYTLTLMMHATKSVEQGKVFPSNIHKILCRHINHD